MKIRNCCGCGLENYTIEDWIAHWKYGKSKWRAIQLLLVTKLWVEFDPADDAARKENK